MNGIATTSIQKISNKRVRDSNRKPERKSNVNGNTVKNNERIFIFDGNIVNSNGSTVKSKGNIVKSNGNKVKSNGSEVNSKESSRSRKKTLSNVGVEGHMKKIQENLGKLEDEDNRRLLEDTIDRTGKTN